MTETRKLTIPHVRQEMLDLADALDDDGLTATAGRLRYLESQLYRRKPVRRVPPSEVTTADQKAAVLALSWMNPDWSYQRISAATGLNVGRISEILAGKRGE